MVERRTKGWGRWAAGLAVAALSVTDVAAKGGGSAPAPTWSEVQTVGQRALQVAMGQMDPSVEELWLLDSLGPQVMGQRGGLSDYLSAMRGGVRADPLSVVLSAPSKAPAMPAAPRPGRDRLAAYVGASACGGATWALKAMDAFTRQPATGYLLGYQVLALWEARRRDQPLSTRVYGRMTDLYDRLLEEHRRDAGPISDLWLWRAAVLSASGLAPQPDVMAWVRQLVRERGRGGVWTVTPEPFDFEGRPMLPPASSTRGAVLGAVVLLRAQPF